MNEKFDELAKGLAQSVTRRRTMKKIGLGFASFALASLFVGQANAADLYTDASVTANGDGSVARPYWRITDAVARARLLRQTAAIPPGERIVIHVAPGAYLGSKENAVLNKNPRYEALPLLLNVPNLTFAGSTALTTDAQGLPTGIVSGTETLLKTVDYTGSYGDSLVLISRTTDGGVGNDVTVSGLHLDQPDAFHLGCNIFVDRVSNFRIAGNVITHNGGGGITTQLASGIIEGNLAFAGNYGPSLGYLTGGSAAFPARLLITRNRAVNSEGALMLTAIAANYQPHIVGNDLEIVSQQATSDPNDPPNTLLPTVVSNDFSHNNSFGMRLVALADLTWGTGSTIGSSAHSDPKQGMHGVLVATVTNNWVNYNGLYGISVDAAFTLRTSKRPDSLSFSGTFQGNQLLGNGRAGFLFTFTSIWVEEKDIPLDKDNGSLVFFKYLQNSIYDVTVLDNEAAGFDYDNPVADPLDGTVLNNTLIVNDLVIPPGRKISPLNP